LKHVLRVEFFDQRQGIDVTGIDLSGQGEQERRSAIDRDFDGAAGCKRSPAQFGQRMLQS
jgi:hypothetical protein